MDAHLDWVSFSLEVGEGAHIVTVADFWSEAHRLLKELGENHYDYIFEGYDFDTSAGRAPFRYSMERDDRGVRIFGGGANSVILFELTGRACEGLRGEQSFKAFLNPVVDRVSRVDIAVDIRCDARPSEFANDRSHRRFKSVGFIQSATGETCYVGSTRSDRFARVYRYNSPHPRHEDLRCEFVFRRQLAKDAAKALCAASSIASFVAAAGNTYGWKHPVWRPEHMTEDRLRTPIQRRDRSNTVAWLYRTVAPSIKRLVEAGELDWEDFEDYIWNGAEEPR